MNLIIYNLKYKKIENELNLPGVPGRFLFFLGKFGLGFVFDCWTWFDEEAFMVFEWGEVEKGCLDIIFELKKNCVS
jgi:hypothetical protein